MTEPLTLNLEPDALVHPTKYELAIVEALMLWPDDDAKRRQWLAAARIEAGRPHVDRMPPAFLRHYTKDALDATRIAELQPDATRRIRYGFLAGSIVLRATVYGAIEPERASLRQVQGEICSALGIQPRSLNNKASPVRRLRPVAHLWAAHMLASEQGETAFPCRVSGLARFIATAEAIRELAEKTRAKKAPAPVMRAGEAIRLPASLAAGLPPMRIEFGSK